MLDQQHIGVANSGFLFMKKEDFDNKKEGRVDNTVMVINLLP